MIVRELITKIGFRIDESQLRRAESRMSSVGKGLANVGRNMSVFVTLPLALMTKGLISAASEVEVLDKTLAAFLGSAEKAITFRKELFKFAKESPLLTVQEIGQQAQRLLGIGIPVEEVIDTLKTLGNIAAVTRAPLNRIVKAYVDVRQQGVLQGQEVRQFAQNSIGIIQLLTTVLGKNSAEVSALQKNQKITFNQVRKALELMGGAGSKAEAAVKAISKSTRGRILKLKDTIIIFSAIVGKSFLPVINALIKFITKLTEMAKDLNEDTKRFSKVMAAVIAAIGPLLLLFKLLLFLLNPIAVAVATVSAAFALLIDDMIVWRQGGKSILGKVFGDYDEFIKKSTVLWENFKSIFKTDFFKDLKIGLKDLFRDTFQGIKLIFKGFQNIISGFFLLFTGEWDLIVEGVKRMFLGVFEIIAGVFMPLFAPLIRFLGLDKKKKPKLKEDKTRLRQEVKEDERTVLQKRIDFLLPGGRSLLKSMSEFGNIISEKSKSLAQVIGPDTESRLARNLGFAGIGSIKNETNIDVKVDASKVTDPNKVGNIVADKIKEKMDEQNREVISNTINIEEGRP